MLQSGRIVFSKMDEVIYGRPAAEAAAEIVQRLGAERVFVMASGTLNRQTDELNRLRRALELKLFEDQKDSIKLSSLVSNVVDKNMQEKIDVVKTRLIRDFGYDEVSATDILNYVASIFARGDAKERQ